MKQSNYRTSILATLLTSFLYSPLAFSNMCNDLDVTELLQNLKQKYSGEPLGDVLVLGEILIDLVPTGKFKGGKEIIQPVVGGAPGNVTAHLNGLGKKSLLVTGIGGDRWGKMIVESLAAKGVDPRGVQLRLDTATGEVQVNFKDGKRDHPVYDIKLGAWDKVTTEHLQSVGI